MPRGFPEDQSAVSAIVAAVLMLGLMVTVLGIVQLTYVPEWKKNAEMGHTETVSALMGQVKASMEALADASLLHPEWAASEVVAFPLGGGSLPIFDPRPSVGTLYIDPAGGGIRVYYNSSYISPVLNESLTQTGIDRSILVRDIEGFNFTLYSIGPNSTFNMTLTLTSTEDVPHYMRFWQDGLDLVYQVDRLTTAFSGNDLRVSRYFQGNQTPIDVLNFFPGLRYRTGSTVVTTALSPGGSISSTWNISTFRLTASPTAQNVSGGGGEVGYNPHNYYYVDRQLVVTGGGLVMVQGNQSVMYLPPPLTVQAVDPTLVRVRVLIFNISGQYDTISGAGNAQVRMTVASDRPAKVWVPAGYANANNLTLVINTTYPSAWQLYLRDQVGAAGLNATLGQYTITTSPGSVTLKIEGKLSGSTQDIELEVVEAYIYTTLGGFT